MDQPHLRAQINFDEIVNHELGFNEVSRLASGMCSGCERRKGPDGRRTPKPRDELAPSHPSLPEVPGRVALRPLGGQHS
jgi:hypothetical protein